MIFTASYAKHSESKKHKKSNRKFDLIIPGWLIPKSIESIPRNRCNPGSLKQNARDNIAIGVKQLKTELAKRMKVP